MIDASRWTPPDDGFRDADLPPSFRHHVYDVREVREEDGVLQVHASYFIGGRERTLVFDPEGGLSVDVEEDDGLHLEIWQVEELMRFSVIAAEITEAAFAEADD